MAFSSNLQAINAANAMLKQAYAFSGEALTAEKLKQARGLHFSIEKHDAEWHALIIAPLPEAQAPREPHSCLISDRDGIFAFPRESDPIIASSTMDEDDFEAQRAPAAGQAAFASAAAFFSSRSPLIPDAEAENELSDQDQAEQDEADANRRKADEAAADALANQQQATSELKNGKIWIHASSCESPVKRVWAIADAMIAQAKEQGKPAPSRKEVQDECIRQGVASGTARTQYQAWKKANDNDAANAENAKRLSEALNARTNGNRSLKID